MRQEGVGASTETSSADGNLTGHGLVAFADDTSFFETTPERAQRSAQIVEDVLALVCLKIDTQKSLQMSLIWVTQKGIPMRKVNSEFTVAETVHMGGEPVPLPEHDEGLSF